LERKDHGVNCHDRNFKAMEQHMPWHRILLAIAAAAMVAATLAPTEASARSRVVRVVSPEGLAATDFCGGRLPAYGVDACGYRELSHGPDSCWRRLPYRPYGPQPRRVWVCG
jgi:hypothetical protein